MTKAPLPLAALPQICAGATHTTTLSRKASGDYTVRCSCGDAVTSLGSWGQEHAAAMASLHRMTGEAMETL